MKIDVAIHSSDDNSLYLDFWDLTSKLWKLKFNITPVLLHFGTKPVDNTYGRIIRIKPLSQYPVATQCQCSRYHYATTLKNKVGIISDIDMLPLSPYYFKDQIKDVDDSKYVHLNPCFDTYPNVAACYHVAKGHTFKNVLGKYNSLKEYMKSATNFDNTWFCDEKFSTEKIKQYNDQSIFEFIARDQGQNGHRIDRPNWVFDENLLKENWYYDAHCPRPYQNYKESIDKIVGLTIGTN